MSTSGRFCARRGNSGACRCRNSPSRPRSPRGCWRRSSATTRASSRRDLLTIVRAGVRREVGLDPDWRSPASSPLFRTNRAPMKCGGDQRGRGREFRAAAPHPEGRGSAAGRGGPRGHSCLPLLLELQAGVPHGGPADTQPPAAGPPRRPCKASHWHPSPAPPWCRARSSGCRAGRRDPTGRAIRNGGARGHAGRARVRCGRRNRRASRRGPVRAGPSRSC